MRIRLCISTIRGIGLIIYHKRYYALWFEWADGGSALPSGRLKPLWIVPRIRFVHT